MLDSEEVDRSSSCPHQDRPVLLDVAPHRGALNDVQNEASSWWSLSKRGLESWTGGLQIGRHSLCSDSRFGLSLKCVLNKASGTMLSRWTAC